MNLKLILNSKQNVFIDSYTFESSLQTTARARPIYFFQPAAVCRPIHEYTFFFFLSSITELQLVIQSCVAWLYWLYWLTASLFPCL